MTPFDSFFMPQGLWHRLRTMASFGLLGAVLAGCLGHHGDSAQWACLVAGCWLGLPRDPPLRPAQRQTEVPDEFRSEADAPTGHRVLVFGSSSRGIPEMAMAWKDGLDGLWYYAPQGGLLAFTVEEWCHVPTPPSGPYG